MRNASMIGQALPPIEFPYPARNWGYAWHELYPDYTKRMDIIARVARGELQEMIRADKQADKQAS